MRTGWKANCEPSLKILYYNWADYLDAERRGGGVSVYQSNLMQEIGRRPDVEAVFLSSGLSYDLPSGAPRWEAVRHGPWQDRERRYEIVNSGVLAPAHHAFGDARQVEDAPTREAFFDFIAKTGPYDVVHFSNLEGLPASVLSLKARWPETRVILSLHNYYPICPQVNLWFQERETCADFANGAKCAQCLPHQHNPRHLRLANGMAYRLKRAGAHPDGMAFKVGFVWSIRVARRLLRAKALLRRRPSGVAPAAVSGPSSAHFAARRSEMGAAINAHCDRVLCVSDAARRLAQDHGVAPELTHTSYIGTREAAEFSRTALRPRLMGGDGNLTLGYLGYMRRDKGFYFLLDALRTLPPPLAARVRLVVAARRGDPATMDQLASLGGHLGGLHHVDGYSHDDLDDLLGQVDVGVVPVLWHDNLPQVAIEMHARHIPLLTSDMGGAQELSGCADMVFRAGDAAAFHDRIAALLEGRVDMQAYWRDARAPTGMSEHLEDLFAHYRG